MNREIYATDGEYTLCPIAEEDRELYVELHRQTNGESTLFLNPYVKDIMWDGVMTGENKVYSIFDANSEYCGSMELQHPDDDTPEIGIDLLESKRNKGIAAKVVRLLAREAYEERNVEYFLLRISSRNKHSRHVAEKIGAILIDEEDTMFERFLNAIDEEHRATILEYLQERNNDGSDDEDEVIYRYKLLPEVFNK